ncbi:YiiX/YebB-like N1pC/P60 family cysteine hydrolase [Janthinobacterium sp. J1-1]|uniref:YiiX/YebB-like N1pC/P60 family cysteine hydrolase n=1 Tax=Janthinobacterium sp. J1-1 TaxID=3065910 RepID=UPI0035B4C961
MIYVARGSVMDSTNNGVNLKNIQKIFYEDDCSIYVLRLVNPIEESLTDNVIDFVRASTGTPYSMREAVLSAGEIKDFNGNEKMFCSRLVARAYASVGINLHHNPNFCTPDDLKNSSLLHRVENFSIQVTEQEIENILSAGDDTKGMTAVTNNLLEAARRIYPKILNLQNIIEASVNFPKMDFELAAAYKNSGYLDYWRTQEEKYPWRYETSAMLSMHDNLKGIGLLDELINYCEGTLSDDKNGAFLHWYKQAAAFKDLYRKFPREVLRLELEPYTNLCNQHDRRISVIEQLKEEKGLQFS